MPAPPIELIENDCFRASEGFGAGVVKLTLTRGPGPRGYAPPPEPSLTRIVVSTAQQVSEAEAARPLTLRVCETRLGRNPQLAGMKHLNRLEQVLAARRIARYAAPTKASCARPTTASSAALLPTSSWCATASCSRRRSPIAAWPA